jgi:hypothetical protein
MELGGKVTIVCEKTRYSADIEFKLKVGILDPIDIPLTRAFFKFKPFIGGQELTNYIEGRIRLEDDIMYTFCGRWDDEITLVDTATNVTFDSLKFAMIAFVLCRRKKVFCGR